MKRNRAILGHSIWMQGRQEPMRERKKEPTGKRRREKIRKSAHMWGQFAQAPVEEVYSSSETDDKLSPSRYGLSSPAQSQMALWVFFARSWPLPQQCLLSQQTTTNSINNFSSTVWKMTSIYGIGLGYYYHCKQNCHFAEARTEFHPQLQGQKLHDKTPW